MNKYLHNPWIVSMILFLAGLFLLLSHIYHSDFSFTIISNTYPTDSLKTSRTHELFKGDKITGLFIAKENNLGILMVRFDNLKRINDDVIRFRLKRQGSDSWYFEGDYSTKMMHSLSMYPFGFPEIADSKGKSFIVEIESLNGRPDNAIALDRENPTLMTKYKVSLGSIAHDTQSLVLFAQKKLVSSVTNFRLLEYSFAYFSPFFLYILRRLISRFVLAPLYKLIVYVQNNKAVKRYPLLHRLLTIYVPSHVIAKYSLIWIMLSLTIVDIFAIEAYSYVMMVFLLVTWYISLKEYSIVQLNYLHLGRIFLFIAPMLYIMQLHTQAQKTAAWACIFLLIGAVSALRTIKKSG